MHKLWKQCTGAMTGKQKWWIVNSKYNITVQYVALHAIYSVVSSQAEDEV